MHKLGVKLGVKLLVLELREDWGMAIHTIEMELMGQMVMKWELNSLPFQPETQWSLYHPTPDVLEIDYLSLQTLF